MISVFTSFIPTTPYPYSVLYFDVIFALTIVPGSGFLSTSVLKVVKVVTHITIVEEIEEELHKPFSDDGSLSSSTKNIFSCYNGYSVKNYMAMVESCIQ